ncbi:DNA replication and repair protein RecF [Abditibacteriota bacterium]|nr:DNA replication and repair protein RecF [Abditibacteriota bacterium]
MILRRLSLTHWRAHAQLNLALSDGLNVVAGRNESGKSSLVEALDWVLFRDITGGAGRIKTDEIRCIVPATDPTARPRVEAEIEFSNCTAIISKVVCEDANKRECRLCLRQSGQADEWFERTEAQNKLRELLAADGIGPGRGTSPEGALLVAHQGEGVEFVLDGGAAIRSTLGVGDEGDLALTNRLERARQTLERERKRDLMLELAPRALDGAKAGTEAARARDEWKAALSERAKFEAMSGEIEVIRSELEDLRAESGRLKVLGDEASARQDSLGDRMNAQYEADRALSEAELERREALAIRNELAGRVREIEHLCAQQTAAQNELDSLSDSLQMLEVRLEAARANSEDLAKARDVAEVGWAQARETLGRWRSVWEVYESDRHLRTETTTVDLLIALTEDVAATQGALDNTPPAPDEAELRALRRDFESLEALEREAGRGLQIALEAHANIAVRFRADKDTPQTLSLQEGERQIVGARASGAFDVENVGRFRIKTGARGVEDLQTQIEDSRANLAARLLNWNVSLDEMPAKLHDLEAARAERDRARRELSEARKRLEDEENKSGDLPAARVRLKDASTEFDARRNEAKRFQDTLKFQGLRRTDVRQKVAEMVELESEAQSDATRARNAWDRGAHEVRVLESEWNVASNRPDQLRATLEDLNARLERLRDDAIDDEARQLQLRQAQERAIKAEMRAGEANSQRGSFGNSVDKFKVEAARREAVRLAEERSTIERRLAERRRDLFHLCEQDPETRRDELDATIECLEPLVAEYEAKLRGLAIVCAAMEALRARLGRDLGGPLNQKLSPWLSKLRGKDTHLIFSDDGAKLLRVRTKEGGATIELPFSEHSEGMKEQVAFALRLLLAQKVVARLPSKKGCVVLDDPFTQSDSSRRRGLGEVLSEALESLQIVFVTCHLAPILHDHPVNLIKLGDWDEMNAEVGSRNAEMVAETEKPKKEKRAKKVVEVQPEPVVESETEEVETLALF